MRYSYINTSRYIQCVSGGKVDVLRGHSIGHSKKKLYMYMCPILNGFLDRAISLYSGLDLGPDLRAGG
jgi:hypothetical protein